MKRTRSSASMDNVSDDDDDYEYNYYSDDYPEEIGSSDTPNYVPCDSSKYMDAGDADLMAWADGQIFRLPVVSLIRQVLKSPTANTSMMISRDDLYAETDSKEFLFFVRIHQHAVILYSLTFQTDRDFGSYAPRLRCLTYCQNGTYLYPNALLPNTFSKFVDFGKVFTELKDRILTILPPSTTSAMLPSIPHDGFEASIQDLAHLTQFHTSALLSISDCGIVTGVDRQVSSVPRSGIGYSTGNHHSSIVITQDTAYISSIITILTKLHHCLTVPISSITMCSPSYGEAINASPLLELLQQLVAELSVEEASRQNEYSTALFTLLGIIQSILLLPESILNKIAVFKSVLGDDCGLAGIMASTVADIPSTTITTTTSPPVVYTDSFSHHVFASAVARTKPALLRRMKIEISTLTDNLPADITVMISEQHLTQSRFLIRGPADTPYYGGFFLFDMNLPSSYPEVPPTVNIITTGGGSARFNPNLYACGKVCLSLLGTWAGEKWNPQLSNLNQVLQSILYMIFITDPYFNEPGYEASKHTATGQLQSKHYNMTIRKYTLRHAILDHLTRPNAEFGDIITAEIKQSWPQTRAFVMQHWVPDDGGLMETIQSIDTRLAF